MVPSIAGATRALVVACLSWLVTAAAAVELPWATAAGDAAPAGWELASGSATKAVVRTAPGEVAVTADPGSWFWLERALPSLDGTDQAPLRIDCAIAVDEGRATDVQPASLALHWASGAVVAVGTGNITADQPRRWANRSWFMALGGPKPVSAAGDVGFYRGRAPAHVRLLITTRTVTAYASLDGFAWKAIGSVPRTQGCSGPPARLALGRGAVDKDAAAGLRALPGAKPGKPTAYRFRDLRVDSVAAGVPASLMRHYDKKDSREETLEAVTGSGMVKQWQVLGPMPPRDEPYAVDALAPGTPLPSDLGAWKPFSPGESPSDRIIVLSEVLPGDGENAWRYAVADFTLDAPRTERFLFDGIRGITLFVDGVELASDERDGEATPDRLSATARLGRGEHRLVLRVSAGRGGRSVFTARREDGDQLYRIALLQRLAIDFPDDLEATVQAAFETARLWEHLGHPAEAARALDEVAKLPDIEPDQIDRALVERARLHRELGDDERVASGVKELTRRWSDAAAGDAAGAHLKAARLWARMGMADKAAAELAEAAKDASLVPERRIEIALEQARMHARLNDEPAIASALAACAAALPPADLRRGELLAHLALRQHRAGKDPAATLAEAVAGGSPVALRLAAAIHGARNEHRQRAAALARLPAESRFEAPDAWEAEALVAAGDQAGAAKRYAAAIAASSAKDDPEVKRRIGKGGLAELRAAHFRASLVENAGGVELIGALAKAADGPRMLPAEPRSAKIAGPISNADWRCYDPTWLSKAGVDPARPDTAKPVETLPWQPVPAGAWANQVLDITRLYNPGTCCALVVWEIDADVETPTKLSMGADDGLVVWMNGEKVHEDRTQRGISPDSIQFPVTFRKGRNVILAMVQQGGGGWSVQMRIVGGSAGADVAGALASVDGKPDARGDVAHALMESVDALARAGSYQQALALARATLRSFPDAQGPCFTIAVWLDGLTRANHDHGATSDAAQWFDSSPAAIDPAHDPGLRDLRWRAAQAMLDSGQYERAARTLDGILRTLFDSWSQAHTLRLQGDLFRRAGFPRQATASYLRAQSAGVTDDHWNRDLQSLLARARPPKLSRPPVETSFELDNLLRTAERAVEANDLERAVTGFQEAIDTNGVQMCLGADGRVASAGTYAAARLRALGEPAAALWNDRWGARARRELAEAVAIGTPEALEQVAARYPLGGIPGQALWGAAQAYAARGSHAAAAATCERILAAEAPADAGAVAALWSRSAARAGDRPGLARARAALEKAGTITVAGAQVAGAAYAAQQEKLLPKPAAVAADLSKATVIAAFAVPAEARRDLRRIHWMQDLHGLSVPLVADGRLFISTLDALLALDAANGRELWRDRVDLPALRQPRRWANFHGVPWNLPAASEGLVVARLQRGGTSVIEARGAADGRLRWSTEAVPGMAGWFVASAPAIADGRVFVVIADGSRVQLAAYLLADGRPLWTTPLASRRPSLATTGDTEIDLAGYLATPTVSGRDVLVAPDVGLLACIDAGSGLARWVSGYSRGQVDPGEGAPAAGILAMRAPTRVWADADHLLFTPRDSLSVQCFRRDGRAAWSRELSLGRVIAGIAGIGEARVALLLGHGIEAIDVQTGATRWRWRGDDGGTIGEAAIGADEVAVSTRGAIHRIALADGGVRERRTWQELGIAAPPLNLALAPGGLIGVGNGSVVRFGDGVAAAGAVAAQPGVLRDAAIDAVEMPAAPPGSPLAAIWRVGDDGVESIDRPDDAAPGEIYVRFSRSLARIDVAKRRVLWRAPIPADTAWCKYRAGKVLCGHRVAISAIDRETGAPLWSMDCSGGPVDALAPGGDAPSLSVGETAAFTFRPYWSRGIFAFSLTDGRRLGYFDAQGGTLAVTERGGTVFVAVRRDDHSIAIEARKLDALSASGTLTEALPKAGAQEVGMPAGDDLLVRNAGGAARFDTATRTVRPFPIMFDSGSTWKEDGRLMAYLYRRVPDDRWISAALDPATDALQYQEITGAHGGHWAQKVLTAYHANAGKLVRIDWDRGGKNGIVCRGLDGKELWYAQGAEWWVQRWHALAMLDGVVVAFYTTADGVFGYRAFALDSGKVLSSGVLPGWPEDDLMPTTTLGGTILYGTPQGLFALVPTTPEAASGEASGGVAPAPQNLGRLAVYDAAEPMRIDGHLDDWDDVDPVELRVPRDARRIAADGGTPDPATVRLCWDAAGVYAAVEVADGQRRDPATSASVITGDSVMIAIDTQVERFRGSAPLTAYLAVIDGRPLLQLGGTATGQPVGGEGDRARMRARIGTDGTTYELYLPWALLRGEGKRPGDAPAMRIGALVLDHDAAGPGALEMGYGLALGFDQSLWRRCVFVPRANRAVSGLAFTLHSGRAIWGNAGLIKPAKGKKEAFEVPWLLDDLPKGAQPFADGGDQWTWVTEGLPPGHKRVHPSASAANNHQHYFQDAKEVMKPKPEDRLYAWVWLDPKDPPKQVMLQFNVGGSWEHRAYWGENLLPWGGDNSPARRHMGPLPKVGEWVRLEVPPEAVGID